MSPRERTLPGWHGSPARRTHVADARVIDVTFPSQQISKPPIGRALDFERTSWTELR
jgi:hypothetical protein